MDDWLARYAAALTHGLPDDAPAVDLGPGGDAMVRELARLVEDGAGPDSAPPAVFLAAAYVALKAGAGADARQAMEEALRVARRIASPGGDAPRGDAPGSARSA